MLNITGINTETTAFKLQILQTHPNATRYYLIYLLLP